MVKADKMKTLVIQVETFGEAGERWAKLMKRLDRGEQVEAQGTFLTFASIELMGRVLTAKRWDLLRAMMGQDAMSIRALARRVGRDVKAVHGDVHALLVAGVIHHAKQGNGVIFPYDAVHVDFLVTASNEHQPTARPRKQVATRRAKAVTARKRAAAKRAKR